MIRLLCPHCKQAAPATNKECELLGVKAATLYRPTGCEQCKNIGYSGRSGIYELIAIDDSLRTMIHDRQPEQHLKKYARTLFPSIRQDGFKRVLAGDSSLEEILRVTGED